MVMSRAMRWFLAVLVLAFPLVAAAKDPTLTTTAMPGTTQSSMTTSSSGVCGGLATVEVSGPPGAKGTSACGTDVVLQATCTVMPNATSCSGFPELGSFSEETFTCTADATAVETPVVATCNAGPPGTTPGDPQ
jgi:hypothetical protein